MVQTKSPGENPGAFLFHLKGCAEILKEQDLLIWATTREFIGRLPDLNFFYVSARDRIMGR